jgi:hypothetical protein
MSYSNLGYDLTGYTMGLIKNKSFKEVMNETLFQPLGITSATFDVDLALKKSFAGGFDGSLAFPTVQIPMLAAGGIFISVIDAAKLVSFHLREGENENNQLINPKLFKEMYYPQSNKTTEYGYGFGLYSIEKIGNAKLYGHSGGGFGYQTIMQWIPKYRIGVVVLSNNEKESWVGSIARKALDLIIENIDIINKPLSPEILNEFEGTYCADGNTAPHMQRVALENDKLFVYFMNGTRVELIFLGSNSFLSTNKLIYTFERHKDGHQTIHIGNTMFPYIAKYNDGVNDGLGPNKGEWQEYIGIYIFEDEVKLNYLGLIVINGYLYLSFNDNLKLQQYNNEIYFTADGEVLILGKNELIYKGIRANKVEFDATQFIQNVANNDIKFDYYKLAVSNLTYIQYTLNGFRAALNFIELVVQIDTEFNNNFVSFGKRLYALGKKQEAKTCFKRVLEIDQNHKEAKDMIANIVENQIQ